MCVYPCENREWNIVWFYDNFCTKLEINTALSHDTLLILLVNIFWSAVTCTRCSVYTLSLNLRLLNLYRHAAV